jgi:hypothetical protein
MLDVLSLATIAGLTVQPVDISGPPQRSIRSPYSTAPWL